MQDKNSILMEILSTLKSFLIISKFTIETTDQQRIIKLNELFKQLM